ncbi:dienelactone hydrolase family protein [Roseococcus sp.]|uniref:dienelactone hydrolase family protein n=1 Tax=Roseococcus sp. TaxID=2109646 RepID=UPI003BAA6CEF
MIRRALLAAVALLAGACAPETGLSADGAGELVQIPAPNTERGFTTRICRPAARGPARLVVINHGSPGDPAERPRMRPAACDNDAVRWFTARGYVVALPMRRGYGATGGAWAEEFGGCVSGNYRPAGLESAQDILTVTRAMQARADVARGPALVVGQSAGGWGALALSSLNPEEVGALVNFAGGRGGWRGGVANSVCREDRLIAAAGEYGRTARVPTLWIYAANDSFFDNALASRLIEAYRSGGGRAEFFAAPAFGRDGHGFFFGRGGSAVWGPRVERFLRR